MKVDDESWAAAMRAAGAWAARSGTWPCDSGCSAGVLCFEHAKLALGARDAWELRAVMTDPEIIEALRGCAHCSFTVGEDGPRECRKHSGTTERIRGAWSLPYRVPKADVVPDGTVGEDEVEREDVEGSWGSVDADTVLAAEALKASLPPGFVAGPYTVKKGEEGTVSVYDGVNWVEIGTVDDVSFKTGPATVVSGGGYAAGGGPLIGITSTPGIAPSTAPLLGGGGGGGGVMVMPSTGTTWTIKPTSIDPPADEDEDDEPKMVQVNFRTSPVLRERLKGLAVRNRQSIQELLGEMIERAVTVEETVRARTATSSRVEIKLGLVRSPAATDVADLMKLFASVAHAQGWPVEMFDAVDIADTPF